jgi:hypothetical protein
MPESSPEQFEMTRKIGARLYAEVLQRLAEVTQERAADCMGVHASTLSRSKEDIERACHLMAALGLQFSPVDAVVITKAKLHALEDMGFEYLRSRIESRGRDA